MLRCASCTFDALLMHIWCSHLLATQDTSRRHQPSSIALWGLASWTHQHQDQNHKGHNPPQGTPEIDVSNICVYIICNMYIYVTSAIGSQWKPWICHDDAMIYMSDLHNLMHRARWWYSCRTPLLLGIWDVLFYLLIKLHWKSRSLYWGSWDSQHICRVETHLQRVARIHLPTRNIANLSPAIVVVPGLWLRSVHN